MFIADTGAFYVIAQGGSASLLGSLSGQFGRERRRVVVTRTPPGPAMPASAPYSQAESHNSLVRYFQGAAHGGRHA